MSILKGKSDGGQGGKLGHSNMEHWEFTEEIKAASRKRRRLTAKIEITQGLAEFVDSQSAKCEASSPEDQTN